MSKSLSFFEKTILTSAIAISGIVSAQSTFQQDFSSSTTVADYVASPASGTTDKFDAITSSGSGTVWSAAGNNLKATRTGNAGQFSRLGITGTTAPVAMSVVFDVSVSSTTAQTNAGGIFIGNGYSSTANSTPTNATTNSRLGFNFTTTDGSFTIRNIAGGSNSSVLTGVQKITWIINNSGADLTYTAPDGSSQTVATNKADVWTGTTIAFDEMAATTNGVALNDLKFAFTAGTGSITLDNIVVIPLTNPTLAVSNAQKDNTQIYSDKGQIVVKSDETISSVKVYDLSGKLLSNVKTNSKSVSTSISDKLVLVHVQFANGKMIAKKVKL